MMISKLFKPFSNVLIRLGLVASFLLPAGSRTAAFANGLLSAGLKPQTLLPLHSDRSLPLSAILPQVSPQQALPLPADRLRLTLPAGDLFLGVTAGDPSVVQRSFGLDSMPALLTSFEGVSNQSSVFPPDTQGDIGYDPTTGKKYYVQWVNLWFGIWDVTDPAAPLQVYPDSGFASGNVLWQGFGGACETSNDGDPITLFDPLARRWFMSQFALPNIDSNNRGPFLVCIAVSQSADPTGAWYRYAYPWTNTAGQNVMNDYPKFGVWPDAYYMSVNQFAETSMDWAGSGVAAFERSGMLSGDPGARMVRFDLLPVDARFSGLLPADLDGNTPPADGAPGLFVEWDEATTFDDPADMLRLWEFHVDWDQTDRSTFGQDGQPNAEIPTSDVSATLCGGERGCIPQPGNRYLDAIGDRLMYRLAYRNFGSYEALVTNHTVDVDGNDHAGIHWMEMHRQAGVWSLYQDGVYAPDAHHRWMGSAAQDRLGNLALGYSVSSGTLNPSIRYTGRLAADPLNQLPQGEKILIAGGGYQDENSYNRWGDYSMLAVDPTDDCTFWYTNQYYPQTTPRHWYTRIGAFRFANCMAAFTGTLQGTVTSAGTPLSGATVQASLSPTQTYTTQTASSGHYTLTVPAGTYDLAVSKYGYQPRGVNDVPVRPGLLTTRNFNLLAAPTVLISGQVSDAATHWPLYAAVDIRAPGYPGSTVWTSPQGVYALSLVPGITYTFNVSAWVAGYDPVELQLKPAVNLRRNFALDASAACVAPGYQFTDGLLPGAAPQGCQPPSTGGLVFGNVYDANTHLPLPGALVSGDAGQSTHAAATSDPALPDAFYILYSLAGTHTFSATLPLYGAQAQSTTVISSQAVGRDLELPAGFLSYAPPGFQVTLPISTQLTTTLVLSNTGGLSATVRLSDETRTLGHTQLPGVGKFLPYKRFKQNWSAPEEMAPLAALRADFPGLASGLTDSIPGGPRYRSAAATCDGRSYYLLGGALASNILTRETWLYDPETGWTSRAPMPYALMNMGAVCIDHFIYLVGGYNGSAHTNHFLVYDTRQNTWTASSWPRIRTPMLAAYQDKLYAFGGNPGPSAETFVYDPSTATWNGPLADMPAATAYGAALRVLEHLVVLGGTTARVQIYDPTANTWHSGPDLPQARLSPLVGWYGEQLYVTGGGGLGGDLWAPYPDPLSLELSAWPAGTWNLHASAGLIPLVAAAQACVAGRIYAPGGIAGETLYALHQYLDEGLACHTASADVSWLSEQPLSGTLAAGTSLPVQVRWDAGVSAVTGPGNYLARIVFSQHTPYLLASLPVTMTVVDPRYQMSLSPLAATQFQVAGQSLTYTLRVTNSGVLNDGFAISLAGNTFPTSAPAAVDRLAPGATAAFPVRVAVPAGAAVGASDGVSVTVAFQHASIVQATARLTTHVSTRLILPFILRP